ncbi:hypothetical protein [Actinophytocola sediminis]
MTTDAEQWHTHWHRIREDAIEAGHTRDQAAAIADRETTAQFGPEPQELTDA